MKEKQRLKLLERAKREAELHAAMMAPMAPPFETAPVIHPRDVGSSSLPWGDGSKKELVAGRVTGEMVWSHKTAPVLQIHGRGVAMTPEEYAASRRR